MYISVFITLVIIGFVLALAVILFLAFTAWRLAKILDSQIFDFKRKYEGND